MKKLLSSLTAVFALIFISSYAVFAQTNGSIAGTVADSNGAVVPNATVTVKGQGGEEFTATTRENGTYRVPAVQNGLYTVTVTLAGFKTSVTNNVKVDIGLPTTVDATMEVGAPSETVEVSSGGEVLQTQTATVGTTVTGRQITETPIASRDALDLVNLMPGTASVGAPRRSSINGLPKGSLSITIDGVDVQDNSLRSSDGYFTYVRPRVDAIEEVTVSTANPGSETGGDGAVQIKFVTKRGTNQYRGGVFYQHRNTALNAAYFYNNRDVRDDPVTGFIPDRRNKIRLNQFGGRLGGPLPFPNFGINDGPIFKSGKDKLFFFFNYEQFRQPESQSRTRRVLTADAQAGNYSYISGGVTRTANLYSIAAANAGQTSTPDPVIGSVLTRIRSSLAGGTLAPVTNAPNFQDFTFLPVGGQVRKFLALRFDFNINKNNSVEFVTNRQTFDPSKDFLNSQDERFPGLFAYAQGSARNSYSGAVRSTITPSLVNEARIALARGSSVFSPGISAADFAYQGGFDIGGSSATTGIAIAGITGVTSRNSASQRETPTTDFTDSMTYLAGTHTISFGGQYKLITSKSLATNRIVPTINFGIDATDSAFGIFNPTSLPGASTTQLSEARNLYAVLIGRVTGYTATSYLTADGTYKLNGDQYQESKQTTAGLFVQDSWHVRPNLTINYGLRWQPQGAYELVTANYARLSSFADVYGVSGLGNIFKPGTLTGTVPTLVDIKPGEKAYDDDRKNFAPSVGVVYSPDFGEGSFMRHIFGSRDKSVFRGGYSISYVREGTALVGSLVGANPGGNITASRNLSLGNLTVGTNYRTAGNPNLTPAPFPTSPAYPLMLPTGSSANAFDPNLRTGSVTSYSAGYQREINKNTVVEVRYVGNRGHDLFRQHNINELNTIENGFATEFALAQQNYYANVAAGRGSTYAYFGAGTGTSPLPIILSYFNPATTNNPALPANYNSTLFTNTTLIANLSNLAPNIINFGTLIENSAARRANALANLRPSNFFYVNPTANVGGAYILDNSAKSWYDSGVIEVRRRLSDGLRLQASYVFSKAQSDSFQSNSDNFANFTQRDEGLRLAKDVAVFDIRHQFKIDATYDLPFGKGRSFFNSDSKIVDALVGGFTLLPTIRWQSGSPFSFGNVQLVGMTVKELQKSIKLRKGADVVTYLPDDIILNTQKAFDTNPLNTSGYGTTYGGGGAPTGRYLAPATTGNCQQRYAGECGFNNLIVYGPGFFKFDMTVAKKFKIDEKRNIEFRATFLDALNHPNFRVGGFAVDVVTVGLGGSTFGQLGPGSAYQDISTTNDPGGRLIDLMFRFNF